MPVITEALVTRVGLTESQPASTSQPARKSITLKTPATDNQARHILLAVIMPETNKGS